MISQSNDWLIPRPYGRELRSLTHCSADQSRIAIHSTMTVLALTAVGLTSLLLPICWCHLGDLQGKHGQRVLRLSNAKPVPPQYRFVEPDLVGVDFNKVWPLSLTQLCLSNDTRSPQLVGKWTLRASTTKKMLDSHTVVQQEGHELKATSLWVSH